MAAFTLPSSRVLPLESAPHPDLSPAGEEVVLGSHMLETAGRLTPMSQRKGQEAYDVFVVGAGTAGLVTAAAMAGLGARVGLAERGRMGGDCLNTGCVPSKALIS